MYVRMKKLIIPFFAILFASCATKSFYQVYKASTDHGILTKDKIVFEDESCKVAYDLWADGGNVGFGIYNKTESDLTLDLTRTYFVLNGVANEYFQNRTFTRSASSGTALTTSNFPYYYYLYWAPARITGASTTSFATSYIEKPLLTIPPKTRINVSEFHVVNRRYVNCDLLKYPTSKTIKSVKFDRSDSPFVFYNVITYRSRGDSARMENEFYISEIANYPEKSMFATVDTSMCGRTLEIPDTIFKDVSSDKFYYRYTRE